MVNISIRMLKKVLSIQSYHNRTGDPKDINIRNYIKAILSSNNVNYYEDSYGNIYATKGESKTYPCLVAHVDTVHIIRDDFVINRSGEFLYAFDNINVKQVGIGGDDKVGIYLVLKFLLDQKAAKAVFFRNEEIGSLGSSYSIKNNKDFYKDCRYIIQPDRKGNDDFITKSGGAKMCSDEFIQKSKNIYEKHYYKEETGISTDVDTLVKNHVGISCINLSCGYYRAHMDTEVVSLDDVEDAYNLIIDLVEHLGDKVYEFKHVEKTYSYSNYKYSSNSSKTQVYKEYKFPLSNVTLDHEAAVFESMFIPLKYNNKMHILQYENIIDTGIECPKCNCKHTLFFLPDENSFFCTSKKCNKFIEENKLVENINLQFYIKDFDGTKYRHMTRTNQWIKDIDSVWKEKLGSYVSKDNT